MGENELFLFVLGFYRCVYRCVLYYNFIFLNFENNNDVCQWGENELFFEWISRGENEFFLPSKNSFSPRQTQEKQYV